MEYKFREMGTAATERHSPSNTREVNQPVEVERIRIKEQSIAYILSM